jgi:hypothetical protein
LSIAKDSIKLPTEEDEVSPQALVQSNRDPQKNTIILPTGLSISSKVQLFLSRHKVHNKQEVIKFHTLEQVFLNQFHHPKRSSTTLFRIT